MQRLRLFENHEGAAICISLPSPRKFRAAFRRDGLDTGMIKPPNNFWSAPTLPGMRKSDWEKRERENFSPSSDLGSRKSDTPSPIAPLCIPHSVTLIKFMNRWYYSTHNRRTVFAGLISSVL